MTLSMLGIVRIVTGVVRQVGWEIDCIAQVSRAEIGHVESRSYSVAAKCWKLGVTNTRREDRGPFFSLALQSCK